MMNVCINSHLPPPFWEENSKEKAGVEAALITFIVNEKRVGTKILTVI